MRPFIAPVLALLLLALCLVTARPARATPILEIPGVTSIQVTLPISPGAFESFGIPIEDVIANPTALSTVTQLPSRDLTFQLGISDANGNSVGASSEYLLFQSAAPYSIASIYLHNANAAVSIYPTHTVIGPADLENAFGPFGGDFGHLGVPQSVVGFGAVPEPSTAPLLRIGLLLLGLLGTCGLQRAHLLSLLAMALLLPASAFAQINVPYQFLGFTTATFTGDQGIFTYHGACAAEFPNSRMCMSEEILRSPTTPTGLAGSAWVQPSFVHIAGASNSTEMADASGISGAAFGMTCGGWSVTGSLLGLTIDAAGRFRIGGLVARCSDARAISCCGPSALLGQGDLNGDGQVDIVDEAIFRRMLAGLPVWVS